MRRDTHYERFLRNLIIVGITLATGLTAFGAPNEEAQGSASPRQNVLLIIVDTLRPDHLGCYGYARNISPSIDAVAQEGTVFEQVYSPGGYTAEVVSTFFSGVLPSRNPHGIGWYATPDPERTTLAEEFKAAGYRTGCFSDHPVLSSKGYKRGFDVHKHFPWIESWVGRGPEVAEATNAFMAAPGDAPFFIYTHVVDPHTPYKPPSEFRDLIDVAQYPEPIEVYMQVRPFCPQLIAEGFGPGEARFDDMVARYDAEIAYSDSNVGHILNKLDELGLKESTTVIITADHAEEFLEHRFVEHGWTLYNEVLHVPFIVRSPGRLTPQRVSTRFSNIDLFPTVLEIAGIDHRRNDLSGFSVFHSEDGRLVVRSAEYPVISEIMVETRNMARSVMAGDYKLVQWRQYYSPEECAEIASREREIREQHRQGKIVPAPMWGPVVREELYNTAADPLEQHNLLHEQPYRHQELARLLKQHERYVRGVSPLSPPTKQAPVKFSPELEEQMRALGYGR